MRTHPSLRGTTGELEGVMFFSGVTTGKWALAPVINLPAALM